jgi:hypothetical protein
MTIIGPTYPAHIAVRQAEVRLVADQTSNAELTTIKADEYSLSNAQEIEIAAAREVDIIA